MRTIILIGCAVFASSAMAAPKSSLVEGVTACKAIVADPSRLACFDAAAAKLADATAKGEVRVVSRDDVRATRRSLFGFSVPKVPLFAGDDSASETPATIDSVVQNVRADTYGKFTLMMEDGAVWKTLEPSSRDLRPGITVHLKAAALGSYFMSIAGGRGIRVVREK